MSIMIAVFKIILVIVCMSKIQPCNAEVDNKVIALAVIPKVMAIASLIGSLFVVIDYIISVRKDTSRKSTYNRLLAAMSSIDICTSTCYFLGTWPIPEGSGPYLASGNAVTCTVQGFIIQAGLAIPFYNLSLSVYYMLVVVYGFNQSRIARIELFFHAVPIFAGLGTATASLFLDLLHNSNLWCWIATNNTLDNNFDLYRWVFFYVPAWLCIIGVTVTMAMICISVLKEERRSANLRRISTKKNLGKQVAWQALCYVGALYIAWVFATTSRIVQKITGKIPYPLLVAFVATLPGQGFWNFLAYIRPRYLRYMKLRNKKRNKKEQNASQNASMNPTNSLPPVSILKGINGDNESGSNTIGSNTTTEDKIEFVDDPACLLSK